MQFQSGVSVLVASLSGGGEDGGKVDDVVVVVDGLDPDFGAVAGVGRPSGRDHVDDAALIALLVAAAPTGRAGGDVREPRADLALGGA
jgi:hypothetical protein